MAWGVVWVVLFLFWCGCGNELELGTSTEDGTLRIGGDPPTLRFGAQTGGGVSGARPVEETTVRGNIFNTRPPSLRPLVVFVFVDLRDPGVFRDFRDAEVASVEDDRTFHVANLAAGSLTVVFLLDQAGANQDGTIDPGDPIAIFHDPHGLLQNLPAMSDVVLSDVEIAFNLEVPENGIATVGSDAHIFVARKPLASLPSSDPPPLSPAGPPPRRR
ncbi:MAG: hypothetical protein NZ578_01215 [Candidatus Binatia bacterium]|nr:hypothetical protein [Candidatus Binatia bacterium]